MKFSLTHTVSAAVIAAAAVLTAGCGEFIRQDRAPVTVVITELVAGEGANPTTFAGTLRSDVRTNGSIFDDMGRVTLSLLLKDQGVPGSITVASPTNTVTINRYRVSFRRSDRPNAVPGVDVPQPFESAFTVTIPTTGTAQATFELIRHTMKVEPPVMNLAGGLVIISTVADITFFGRDQAGNNITTTGSIGVLFGDFADPS